MSFWKEYSTIEHASLHQWVVPSTLCCQMYSLLRIQPFNQEPETSGCAAFPQHMSSQSYCIAALQTLGFIPPHAKSDRKLREGEGQLYRNCDIIKPDRLEEGLLFKTHRIRVALPLQAQASVTLLEELGSGCRDSELSMAEPGHIHTMLRVSTAGL